VAAAGRQVMARTKDRREGRMGASSIPSGLQ
jgi:hypothetical protein